MNGEQLEQARQLLLRQKSELLLMEKDYRSMADTVELDQTRVGRLSRMDAMQSQQMALESARRRQNQILKIEGALRRIESGEYGDCFVCGEGIDERRLAADPTSTRCMGCVE